MRTRQTYGSQEGSSRMIDFEFDPEEDVNRAGAGHMPLRQAVQEIMATPADERGFVVLYREAGKEPSSFDAEQVDQLAALPEFQGDD